MSISAESSYMYLQNEFQILNAKTGKYLIGSGSDNILWLDVAYLSDHCPVIFVADVGGLALSMAKSHWHEALCSAHKELYMS